MTKIRPFFGSVVFFILAGIFFFIDKSSVSFTFLLLGLVSLFFAIFVKDQESNKPTSKDIAIYFGILFIVYIVRVFFGYSNMSKPRLYLEIPLGILFFLIFAVSIIFGSKYVQTHKKHSPINGWGVLGYFFIVLAIVLGVIYSFLIEFNFLVISTGIIFILIGVILILVNINSIRKRH